MFNRREFLIGATSVFVAGSARADTVRMRDLYNKDLSYSDFAESRRGQRVTVQGFMAPPLKAETRFFVLTARPMSVCPFCETEAEWPDDILAVYAKRVVRVIPFNVGIMTTGQLELGSYTDPDTRFVSRVRLADAVYERT